MSFPEAMSRYGKRTDFDCDQKPFEDISVAVIVGPLQWSVMVVLS